MRKNKHILIVDDDSSIRNGLKKLLTTANYTVSAAADGLEAVERFFAEDFDLVIMDLDMPRKDGWAALENITRLNPYVPIAIMTGKPDQHRLVAAAGAGALVEKPFEPESLLETISALLEEPRSNHWLRRRGWLPDAHRIPKTKFVSRQEAVAAPIFPLQSHCVRSSSPGRLVAAN